MRGTEFGYAATSMPWYAMCGTDIAYQATSLYGFALCGTEIGYAATRVLYSPDLLDPPSRTERYLPMLSAYALPMRCPVRS
eukprot:1320845-Rhodomonas_salina.2